MSLKSIADKVACGGSKQINTGKLGCLSLFGTPEHLMVFRNDVEFDESTNFDLDTLTPTVQTGKMYPLIDASSFEDVSADDTYSTNASGEKRLNIKGLPEYTLTFEEGHEFYRELAKLESYKSYRVAIGDEKGNWMLATSSDGKKFKGFKAGHTTPTLTSRKVKGGDPESKSLMIQFLDRNEFDHNYAILHASQLTFMPQDIPLINGVNINFTQIPASTDTTLEIEVVLASDNNSRVEGLTNTGDFGVYVNGTKEEPTAVTETSPGKYKLTITTALAANDKVVVKTNDTTNSTVVVLSNGVLYRGTTGEVLTIV